MYSGPKRHLETSGYKTTLKGIVHPKKWKLPHDLVTLKNVLALPSFIMAVNGGRDFEAQKVHPSGGGGGC